MKNIYLSILAICTVVGSLKANNTIPAIDDNCKQEAVLGGGGTPFAVTCNDATVEVQADLSVPLTGRDISDAPINNLYAVDAFAGGTVNIHLYSYDPSDDTIFVLDGPAGSTGSADQFYGLDYHPFENQVYMLNNDPGFVRSLYTLDIASGTPTFIGNVTSPLGDTQPIDMTFDDDGTLYIFFKSGEIGTYNFGTDTVDAFTDVGAGAGGTGGVGLTYDFDNDRLLLSYGTGLVTVDAIDIATQALTLVTIFSVPDSGCGGTAQGIEYVGDLKAISSTTFGCDAIYTIDLTAGVAVLLTNPTTDGFTDSIKDLMYIDFDVVLDPEALDCGDEGTNTVSVTVTDYAGNVSSCDATVTVTDPNGFCVASVNDTTENQFLMYPNPAGDSFQIMWNANEPLIGLQVFDILGKTVINLETLEASNPVINTVGLAPGVYIVKLQTALGSTTARLLKQ